jgi:hypothetical protein
LQGFFIRLVNLQSKCKTKKLINNFIKNRKLIFIFD